jgi:calcineurin-like phosphoesterase
MSVHGKALAFVVSSKITASAGVHTQVQAADAVARVVHGYH